MKKNPIETMSLQQTIDFLEKYHGISYTVDDLARLVFEDKISPVFWKDNIKVIYHNIDDEPMHFELSGYFRINVNQFKDLTTNKTELFKNITTHRIIEQTNLSKSEDKIIEGHSVIVAPVYHDDTDYYNDNICINLSDVCFFVEEVNNLFLSTDSFTKEGFWDGLDKHSYPPELHLAIILWQKIYLDGEIKNRNLDNHSDRFNTMVNRMELQDISDAMSKRLTKITTPLSKKQTNEISSLKKIKGLKVDLD